MEALPLCRSLHQRLQRIPCACIFTWQMLFQRFQCPRKITQRTLRQSSGSILDGAWELLGERLNQSRRLSQVLLRLAACLRSELRNDEFVQGVTLWHGNPHHHTAVGAENRDLL